MMNEWMMNHQDMNSANEDDHKNKVEDFIRETTNVIKSNFD